MNWIAKCISRFYFLYLHTGRELLSAQNTFMLKKNNMTWRTAVLLSALITALIILPVLPLYLRDIPGYNWGSLGLRDSVPLYVTLIYSIGTNFMVTLLLFLFVFRLLKSRYPILKRNVYLAAGGLLIVIAVSALLLILNICVFTPGEEFSFISSTAMEILYNNLFLAITVLVVSYIIYLSSKRQQIALENEVLKAENMQIRYTALKNQLDPHFLFNTMSILDSLVDEDRQKTHEYIQRFSSVYRYILQSKEVVTLDEELRFVDDYFGLLQVRFGEYLSLRKEINPKLLGYGVVPLGLQSLVENAVQHNVVSRQHPLCITISTTVDHNLVVVNNYQPKNVLSSSSGIGLANLSERCMLRWQKDITIEQTADTFKVTLPLSSEPCKTE